MLVHLGYETALSEEHHSYIAKYNTWNQTEGQSKLGVGCLEGRVADREAGLTG